MVLPERVATWSDKNLEKCWSIGSPELCANVETKFKASAKANVTRVNITEANTQLLFMHFPALTPLITGCSFRICPRICLLKWRPPINFFSKSPFPFVYIHSSTKGAVSQFSKRIFPQILNIIASHLQ